MSSYLIRSITLYGGLPIFIVGTIGNLLNFLSLWRTRKNPCVFIFLSSSIVNCIVLFYGLFTRILSVGFELDWSTTNVIWCKTRIAFTQASFLISLTCVCLASLDRFFASCRQEKYRRFSRLSLAKLSVCLTILFWFGHSIPYLVYAELIESSSTGLISCSLLPNKEYANYRIYVALLFYLGIFPTTILTITGILTYRNTNRLRQGQQRQLIQKRLTKMMLIQIPCILFSTLPYITFTLYSTFTTTIIKSIDQKFIESILTNIFTLIFYMAFSCQFFVFYISSKTFRKEANSFLFYRKIYPIKTNQVQHFSIVINVKNAKMNIKN
ncbi:hypothetical protein I4U23_006047 [Adineta vaga]|nr:hypothetical protein I4U23_006047 [Adineta vaga]